MVSGCLLEVLGYIGRIMSYHNPFGEVEYPLDFLFSFLTTDHINRMAS